MLSMERRRREKIEMEGISLLFPYKPFFPVISSLIGFVGRGGWSRHLTVREGPEANRPNKWMRDKVRCNESHRWKRKRMKRANGGILRKSFSLLSVNLSQLPSEDSEWKILNPFSFISYLLSQPYLPLHSLTNYPKEANGGTFSFLSFRFPSLCHMNGLVG